MKTLRGFLLLDFSIQAILFGILSSLVSLSLLLGDGEPLTFFYIPYFILGGWQLFYSLFLRVVFKYRRHDSYLKYTGCFLLFVTWMMGMGYIGSNFNNAFAGFFVLLLLLMVFIPPFFAFSRFIGAYAALENNGSTNEETLVTNLDY